jgi:hypothetical protein
MLNKKDGIMSMNKTEFDKSKLKNYSESPIYDNIVDMDSMTLSWTKNKDFGTSASLFFGNGQYGGNAYVLADDKIAILLSSTDSFRNSDSRLIKLGRIIITLKTDDPTALEVSQILNLKEGAIEITLHKKQDYKFRIFADANHPLIQVDAYSQTNFELSVEFDRLRPEDILSSADDYIKWHYPNPTGQLDKDLEMLHLNNLCGKFSDVIAESFGVITWSGNATRHGDILLKCHPNNEHHIFISPGNLDELLLQRDLIERTDIESRWQQHLTYWDNAWSKSHIRLRSNDKTPDFDQKLANWFRDNLSKDMEFFESVRVVPGTSVEAINTMLTVHRYLTLSCGRGRFPAKFNGGMFYLDNPTVILGNPSGLDVDNPCWGGHYWFQNTRLIYWGLLATGDFNLMKSFFSMYRNMLPLRMAMTKEYYNHNGAYFDEVINPNGIMKLSDYCIDEAFRSAHPPYLNKNTYIRYYWQSTLELSLLALEFYYYTNDSEFLCDTAIPLVENALTFYLEHYPRDNHGKLLITPAQSLETYQEISEWDVASNYRKSVQHVVNPTPELAGIKYILQKVAGIAQLEKFIKLYDGVLPEIPMVVKSGKTCIDFAYEHNNMILNTENPELYAVFPHRIFGIGKANLQTAVNSYEQRVFKGSWGWIQDDIQAACLGLADEAALAIARRSKHVSLFAKFVGTWGRNNDECPDFDHASVLVVAIQKMLFHAEGDDLLLLPAWPDYWDVEFKLNIPGNKVIECSVVKGKLIKSITKVN